MNTYKQHVLRDTEIDAGDITFAVVTYKAEEELSRTDLRERIADAGSAWAWMYPTGQDALANSSGGLDIEDLEEFVHDDYFKIELEQRGIHDLQIELVRFWVSESDMEDWYYDYLLVEEYEEEND